MSVEQESSRQEVVLPDYEPHLLEDIHVLLEIARLNPRGEPGTFGSTPLDKAKTKMDQLILLDDLLQYTYAVPTGVPLDIADYNCETFGDRFKRRMDANDENYTTSILHKEAFENDAEIQEVIERAEIGHAAPAELLVIRQLLGIRSVELACLTHPYGERIEEYLELMRDTVQDAITSLGGEYFEDAQPTYRLKEVLLSTTSDADITELYGLKSSQALADAEKYGGVRGLLMTRKREIGRMPDGTIIRERSSFILRADENGVVSEDAIKAMADLPMQPNWDDLVAIAGGLDGLSTDLLKNNEYSLAIPVATTIYAFNPETAQQVAKREKVLGVQALLNRFIDDQPLLNLEEESHDEVTVNVGKNNMLYVGPPQDFDNVEDGDESD